MKPLIVDTNILLRYLTKDVPHQAQRVKTYFDEIKNKNYQLILLQITCVEVMFHLERWYGFDKKEAVEKFMLLISPEWLKVEEKQSVYEALELYSKSSIDFVDLLTWVNAKQHQGTILSFDKHFDKLTPKIRIEP